ncbi:MAG TPA: caspase family protein, partial [Thermoanaerobaculia bacterium]|nr:caspase family protein [Thermoanaerobaculia bacterium]
MRAHAIVIGIDKYHEKEWCLDGAVRDAVAFAEWALAHGGVAPSDLTLLLSPLDDAPAIANPVLAQAATPATRAAIVDTFYAYQTGRGKDADRLWFYYAGHGLAPPGSGPDAGPLVVPADVTNPDRYVTLEPVGLELFRGAMEDVAPKEQFYFVDACRDVIPVQGNKILTQQLLWDLRGLDEEMLAMQAVFLATTAGKRAKEVRGHGLFGRALVAALRGLGPDLLPPPPGKSRWLLEFGAVVDFVTEAV